MSQALLAAIAHVPVAAVTALFLVMVIRHPGKHDRPFIIFCVAAIVWILADLYFDLFADSHLYRSAFLCLPIAGAAVFFFQKWEGNRRRFLMKTCLRYALFGFSASAGCLAAAPFQNESVLWLPFLSLFATGPAFAATVNPLIHLERVMRRGFLYFIITVTAIGLTGIFSWVTGNPVELPSLYLVFLATVALVGCLGALHFRYLTLPIPFLFFRSVYEKEKSLSQFVQEIQLLEDAKESQDGVLEVILQNMVHTLGFERSILMTADRNGKLFVRHLGPPSPTLQLEPVRRRIMFLRMRLPPSIVQELDRVFILENDFELPFARLSEKDIRHVHVARRVHKSVTALRNEGYELFIPLLFKHEIWGVILLGPKRSGEPYFHGEVQLLENARPAFAMALRNNAVIEEYKASHAGGWDPARLVKSARMPDAGFAAERVKLGSRTLVFAGDKYRQLVDKARNIAGLSLPVLIHGETGTGKELFARLLHQEGPGAGTPFVAVNCAAVPASLWESQIFGHRRGSFTGAQSDQAGFVEQAAGGVLFFDEIGEMPIELQPKILRLIQEKIYQPVGARKEIAASCRLVFATHRDLAEMCAEGTFREDLYYRINVHRINLPPLRDRRKEIPFLASHILEHYSLELGTKVRFISPETMELLVRYEWPGNIRELDNCVVRAMTETTGDTIHPDNLPDEIRRGARRADSKRPGQAVFTPGDSGFDFEGLLQDYARELLTHTLKTCHGNQSKAARMLNISRGRLIYQMKELGLDQTENPESTQNHLKKKRPVAGSK